MKIHLATIRWKHLRGNQNINRFRQVVAQIIHEACFVLEAYKRLRLRYTTWVLPFETSPQLRNFFNDPSKTNRNLVIESQTIHLQLLSFKFRIGWNGNKWWRENHLILWIELFSIERGLKNNYQIFVCLSLQKCIVCWNVDFWIHSCTASSANWTIRASQSALSLNPFADDSILSSLVQSMQIITFIWQWIWKSKRLAYHYTEKISNPEKSFHTFWRQKMGISVLKKPRVSSRFPESRKGCSFRKCWNCSAHSKAHSEMGHMSDSDSSKKELSSRAEFHFGEHRSKTVQKGTGREHLDFQEGARGPYFRPKRKIILICA